MALRLWLPLNGSLVNQGLSDVVVTNNGATVNNSGKIGKCYSFAKDAYLDIDKSAMTDMISASVCFWIKVNSWNTNWDTVFQAGTGATAWTAYYFGILRNQGNYLCFTISNGSSATNESYKTDNLTVGEWCHVVCSYGDGKCRTYLNGELCNEYTASIIPNFSGITSIKVGGLAGAYKCDCLLSDLRIYDHALSSKEIKELSKGLVLHYPLSDPYVEGTTNLLPSNLQNFTETGISAGAYSYTTSQHGTYTLSGYITCRPTDKKWNAPRITLRIAYSDGTFTVKQDFNVIVKDGKERYFSLTVTSNTSKTVTGINGWLLDHSSGTTGKDATIRCAQLEMKDHATPYTSSTRNENIVYDVSGYQRNGTANNIICDSNTPRYNVSSVFNGTDTYIKVDSNDWMVQGTEEMTISIWGYMDDWTKWGGRRLFSCTESGGFNLETLNAKMAMPVCVYTNVAKTSTAYIPNANRVSIDYATLSPGWHMFTCIYELSGCKFYVDGVLEDEKEYTSYGIYYRAGVPLFLGCEANGANPYTPYFDGMLSDFRLYATALSADDILALYNTPVSIANNGTLLTQGEISEA